MKRLIYSALAMFMAAFSFSSCEDVPAPFNTDFDNNNSGGNTPVVVEPAGDGTVSSPYNVARTLEIINGGSYTADKVYVKGIITQVDEISTSFGNATYYIADAANSTTSFEIFRGYSLNGAKFSKDDEIKVGDSVVVYGTLMSYNGTPEMAQGSQIYSLNGKGGGGGTSTGDMGTEAKPFDVTSALSAGQKTGVYIQGYIVGFVSGKDISTDSKFSAADAIVTNVLIAASATETDVTKCMPVQLPSGEVRTGLNLKDNAGNLGKQVTLYGDLATYFNVQGVKNTTYAKLGSKEYGTKPGKGGSSETVLQSFDFKANGKGDWTIFDVKTNEALSAVWEATTQYGMKATGYLSSSKQNYDTDSWFISPTLDLTKATTLSFSQAANFFANGVESECSVLVSTNYTSGDPSKATWTKLTVDTWPNSWTFVTSTAPLGSAAGKTNVHIAFRYTSTAAKAGTWEISSVSLK